ncbi:putative FecR (plasmid) [Novosphingobium sp. PP1Y]|nr:putative FecR [Novosphingobium sp. PP1Y]
MNDNDNAFPGRGEALKDEAIEWVVHLHGPDAAAFKGKFEQWRAQSPDHRQAYEWAMRHFDASAILKESEQHGMARKSRPRVGRWIFLGLALAAAASVMLATLGNRQAADGAKLLPHNSGQQSALATSHGQIRTFVLADGTSVTLDAQSKLLVTMDPSQRRLDLEQGRVRVTVARDARPLTVSAGAGEIHAREGTFDVSFGKRNILVSFIRGSGTIQPKSGSVAFAGQPMNALAGQRYTYHRFDFAGAAKVPAAPGTNDRQWPTSWFEYRSVPLSVLIGEANRYGQQKIVLDDAGIGAIAVTGRFHLTDTEGFAQRLAESLHLDMTHRADAIHLSRE